MWTGRELRLPSDLRFPLPASDHITLHPYASQLRETIRDTHNIERRTLGTAAQRQKEFFDRRLSGTPFQVGDPVMYRRCSCSPGTPTKFQYSWVGPFTVIAIKSPTTLLLCETDHPSRPPFTAHFDELKRYHGPLPPCPPGTPDQLTIVPADQVPPVALEVTVASPIVDTSTEDSATP
ncbi:unnamed protein product [Dibothriocephalus latus]|uniref:Integrase zinc-binding domain-containing protein n=1 Tax=Dibothriocephalus latus TaxID=60516 RepID=A0A3P7LYF1_DIBLA|nr:unnamed protein product [Dibothriocephalus latus]